MLSHADFAVLCHAAFLSGPAQSALAAQKLNNDRNNVPGFLRATLLGLGKSSRLAHNSPLAYSTFIAPEGQHLCPRLTAKSMVLFDALIMRD